MAEIAHLLHADDELAGTISFTLTDEQIFDPSVKDVSIFYKLVGDSRFKMHRNQQFELVFLRLTEDWMRQAKLSLQDVDGSRGLEVTLTWDEQADILSVQVPGAAKDDCLTARAIQMDD